MVSIHCPPGYEPGALPLRHSAFYKVVNLRKVYITIEITEIFSY